MFSQSLDRFADNAPRKWGFEDERKCGTMMEDEENGRRRI